MKNLLFAVVIVPVFSLFSACGSAEQARPADGDREKVEEEADDVDAEDIVDEEKPVATDGDEPEESFDPEESSDEADIEQEPDPEPEQGEETPVEGDAEGEDASDDSYDESETESDPEVDPELENDFGEFEPEPEIEPEPEAELEPEAEPELEAEEEPSIFVDGDEESEEQCVCDLEIEIAEGEAGEYELDPEPEPDLEQDEELVMEFEQDYDFDSDPDPEIEPEPEIDFSDSEAEIDADADDEPDLEPQCSRNADCNDGKWWTTDTCDLNRQCHNDIICRGIGFDVDADTVVCYGWNQFGEKVRNWQPDSCGTFFAEDGICHVNCETRTGGEINHPPFRCHGTEFYPWEGPFRCKSPIPALVNVPEGCSVWQDESICTELFPDGDLDPDCGTDQEVELPPQCIVDIDCDDSKYWTTDICDDQRQCQHAANCWGLKFTPDPGARYCQRLDHNGERVLPNWQPADFPPFPQPIETGTDGICLVACFNQVQDPYYRPPPYCWGMLRMGESEPRAWVAYCECSPPLKDSGMPIGCPAWFDPTCCTEIEPPADGDMEQAEGEVETEVETEPEAESEPECFVNEDCDDENPATLDACVSGQCSHEDCWGISFKPILSARYCKGFDKNGNRWPDINWTRPTTGWMLTVAPPGTCHVVCYDQTLPDPILPMERCVGEVPAHWEDYSGGCISSIPAIADEGIGCPVSLDRCAEK